MNKAYFTIWCLTISIFNTNGQTPFNKIHAFGYIQAFGHAIFECDELIYIAGTAVPQGTIERNIHVSSFDLDGGFIKSIIWDNGNVDAELNFIASNNNIDIYKGQLIFGYSSNARPDCLVSVDKDLIQTKLISCYSDNDPENQLSISSQIVFPKDSLITISLASNNKLIVAIVDLLNLNTYDIIDLSFHDEFIYIPSKLLKNKSDNELFIMGYFLEFGPGGGIEGGQYGLFNIKLNSLLQVKEEHYVLDNISGLPIDMDAIIDTNGSIVCIASQIDRVALEIDRNNAMRRPVVLKFDKNMELIWQQAFGSYFKNSHNIHKSLVESHDKDGYIIVGFQRTDAILGGDYIGVIGKISHDGDSLWYKQVYDLYDDNKNEIEDVLASSDGYYIATGTRNLRTDDDSIASRVQTWLIKFDEQGDLVELGSTSISDPNKMKL